MTIICPIPKSPHSSGRIGGERYQDWYRSLVIAACLAHSYERPTFLLVTGFQAVGAESEVAIYRRVLEALAPEVSISVIRSGFETIEQVETLRSYAIRSDEELVVVSTFLHALRVRYLMRGMRVVHYVAFGIPRPREVVTDIILTFAMPFIDALGLRERFQEWLRSRRTLGKF